MANGHGGKRTPNKPAQMSPPGMYSKRTDGGYEDMLKKIEGDNPLEAVTKPSHLPVGGAGTNSSGQPATAIAFDGIPFGAPSQRPDELETEGSPFGPGSYYLPPAPFFDDEELYRG